MARAFDRADTGCTSFWAPRAGAAKPDTHIHGMADLGEAAVPDAGFVGDGRQCIAGEACHARP